MGIVQNYKFIKNISILISTSVTEWSLYYFIFCPEVLFLVIIDFISSVADTSKELSKFVTSWHTWIVIIAKGVSEVQDFFFLSRTQFLF